MTKDFLKNIKAELKKVVWPTKEQLINNTILVIILVVALSLIILGFDIVLEFIDANIWEYIKNKVS